MTPDNFNQLLKLVETDIQKQNAHLRDAVPVKINLLQHFDYLFCVHKSTLS